jgi:hypothetical protein
MMRRESSTVVAVAGDVREAVLAEVSRSPNVSLIRPPETAGDPLEQGAQALRKAAGSASPYVLVAADPLAAVAVEWRAMWDITQQPQGGAAFERRAREALEAWQARRFELPDYYLILARSHPADAGDSAPGLYLGPLRAARPHRVAVVPVTDATQPSAQAAGVLAALRALPYGPWWPPLGELLDVARRFYAGGLAGGTGNLAAPAPG